jgi:3-hydroxybutyryl-CoA dehydratase
MRDWNEGDTESISKSITEEDVNLYSNISLDTNPVHLDEEYAKQTRFGRRIAHGMLSAGLVSAVLGTKIPGPGAIYTGQTLRFLRPVYLGDTITATATISRYDREKGRMTLQTVCKNHRGEDVLEGEAEIRYRPESTPLTRSAHA